MFRFLTLCFETLVRLFWSRHSLLLENPALRQQLVVLKRRHPRPKLDLFDKLFWLVVRRCWSGWKQALLVVTPETVVRWQRAGFCWYWRVISKVRKPVGRRPTSKEVRDLIFQMMAENPRWGAPRIHGPSHARSRHFRKNGFPLDETSLHKPGSIQALAHFSA